MCFKPHFKGAIVSVWIYTYNSITHIHYIKCLFVDSHNYSEIIPYINIIISISQFFTYLTKVARLTVRCTRSSHNESAYSFSVIPTWLGIQACGFKDAVFFY